MTSTLIRASLLSAIVLLGENLLPTHQAARACPFCGLQGQTLTGDVNQASMVLYGTLKNAKLDNGDLGGGSTELHIITIIKDHEIRGDRKMVLLPRYVPSDKDKGVNYLIFCDVFKGKVDPYRGVPVKEGSHMVKYLQGALAVKDKNVATRLRFSFDYLDDADLEVSNDAYKEFGNADYKDYRDLAGKLSAAKLAQWLQDPNTPTYRYGTYGSLLGHCGTAKDAELLHKMLDDPKKRVTSGVDGMLAGYILLQPKEGWAFLQDLLDFKKTKKDFLTRYAALRTIRFFWDYRSDVIAKAELQKGAEALLDQSDIADLAIQDLRKWKRFDALDLVLALNDKPSHDIPIIRRAVLSFALCCQDQPKAAAFVKEMRKQDEERVKEVEDLLKLEAAPKTAASSPVLTK